MGISIRIQMHHTRFYAFFMLTSKNYCPKFCCTLARRHCYKLDRGRHNQSLFSHFDWLGRPLYSIGRPAPALYLSSHAGLAALLLFPLSDNRFDVCIQENLCRKRNYITDENHHWRQDIPFPLQEHWLSDTI